MYAEFASVYRQATLMHAHATNHIYDTDRQDEDGNDTFIYAGGTKYLGQYEPPRTILLLSRMKS